MYPVFRLAKEMLVARGAPKLSGLTATHVSHHVCWPWDIDPWLELNNGRTLTLYDLGRTGLAQRTGLVTALARNRWGMTVAGSSARYRRRIRAFDRIEMRSRGVCWDDRFCYLEQSMWRRDGACSSHVLLRIAVTDKTGIVAPARLAAAMENDPVSPPVPDWIARWVAAEAMRPWPPMQS